MRRLVAALPVAFGLMLGLPAPGHPQHVVPPGAPESRAVSAVPPPLVGLWRAPADRVPLSADAAWGPRATAVRLAEMRIRGDGTITFPPAAAVQDAVEIRFETFDGEGTFSDTLRRVRTSG